MIRSRALATLLVPAAAWMMTCAAAANECESAPDVWNARYQAAVKRVVASIGNPPAFCAAKRRQLAISRAWLAWHLGHPQCRQGHPRWDEAQGRLERRVAADAAENATEECR